jgi:cytochrome c oxidase assembly factor CtaG
MAGAGHVTVAKYASAFAATMYSHAVFAHAVTGGGEGIAIADVLGTFLLVLLGLVFAAGQWRVARRTRTSRRGRALCFWTGWFVLALSLGAPFDEWSNRSFAAHMTQHELMMIVAAPLLVAARPLGTLLWGLPKPLGAVLISTSLRHVGTWLSAPPVAWTVHTVVLWAWHLPAAFEAGLRNAPVHWLQHASFFAAAVIYWWSVFSSSANGVQKGLALVSVFTTAIHTGLLGMLLTFSSHVWYATYTHAHNPWALSPIEDQQLGGLIMWVPGGVVFIVAAMVVGAAWLKQMDMPTARS